MWQLLKALLDKLGIAYSDKETELKTAIEGLDKKKDPPKDEPEKDKDIDLSKHANDPAILAIIDQNKALTKSVNDLMTALAKEQTDRENNAKTAADLAKRAQEEKIEALVTKALSEKKITEAEKETFKNLATSNYEATEKVINSLPENKVFTKGNDRSGLPGNGNHDEKPKTFDELRVAAKAEMIEAAKQ